MLNFSWKRSLSGRKKNNEFTGLGGRGLVTWLLISQKEALKLNFLNSFVQDCRYILGEIDAQALSFGEDVYRNSQLVTLSFYRWSMYFHFRIALKHYKQNTVFSAPIDCLSQPSTSLTIIRRSWVRFPPRS